MGCAIGFNIGMMFCGWMMGVVGIALSFVLITGLCILCIEKVTKKTVKDWFIVWWFYLTVILALVISLTITLIVGGLVCFNTGQAIGYGVLISTQTFNLFYHLGFNLLNWYFRGRARGSNKTEDSNNNEEEKKQPI